MKIPEKLQPTIDNFTEKFTNLDEQKKMYVFLGILLLVFVLDYFIIMRTQIKTLSKISPEIEVLSKDLKKTKNDLLRLNQYRKDVRKSSDEVEDLNERIRSREEVPLILEHISRIANDNGVVINQIIPDTKDQELLLENEEREYYALPINLEAKGAYHNVGRFLNSIENNEAYINVGKFSITSKIGKKKHAVQLTFKAIVFENVEKEEGDK